MPIWENIFFVFCLVYFLIFFCTIHLKLIHKYKKDKWIKILKFKHRVIELIKGYGGCVVIIMISLFGFFVFLKLNGNENTDLLGDYCSFLTFVGTFMIGFYIHKKEKDSEKNIRKNKCLRLSNTIATTYISMMTLGNVKSQKHMIIYDREWYTYMTEYIELSHTHKIFDMYEALSTFFDCVDCINNELERNKVEEAIKIRDNYKDKQFYLPIRYNVIDIVNDIDDYKMLSEIGKIERDKFEEDFIRNIFAAQYIKKKIWKNILIVILMLLSY